MNYYTFHIGDYASRTRHLSLMEDLAYRRLLDLYYSNEEGIPLDIEKAARLIGMKDYIQDVSNVISDFFLKSDASYIQERCEEQIQSYQAAAERARNAGISRWNKPKKRRSKGNSTEENLKSDASQIDPNNQEPITNNQEEEEKVEKEAVVFPFALDSEAFRAKWDEYQLYRKTSKIKALKPISVKKQLDEMAEWGEEAAIESINQTIRNGYQGLFAARTSANIAAKIINKPAHKSLFANDENLC